MNWFPVEIDGSLRWEDHSTTFDNDYQFDIVSPNRSLLTKWGDREEVHVEFDSTETVNEWDQACADESDQKTCTWWKDFHHNVVDQHDKQTIQSWFGNKFAIVIGMLGIDMEHGPHSELHPVYAMFINLGPEGQHPVALGAVDHWAFFVRNWGNEGYCGSGDEPLNAFREIGIPLPETEIVRYSISAYAHGDFSLDQCLAETSVSAPDSKGLMVFNLPPATAKCGVVGDLFIRRNPLASTPGSSRRSTVVSGSGEGGEDIDPRLMARIAKLSPVARQELYTQLSDIMKEPSSRPSKASGVIKIMPRSSSGVAKKHPQFAGQGLKAVANPAFEAKKAKQRQLIDTFLKAHGVQ